MSETNDQKPLKRCDPTKLKIGDRLSRIQYYQVIEIEEGAKNFIVRNEQGFKFKVTTNIVENEMHSAHLYTEDRKVTRTELVELLEEAGDTIFTVTFDKKPTDKGIAEKIKDLDPAAISSDRNRRRLARELLSGEERTLVGYLHSMEPKLGRSMVIDLEVPEGRHNIRLVDHRTIKALIYKNIRFYCD